LIKIHCNHHDASHEHFLIYTKIPVGKNPLFFARKHRNFILFLCVLCVVCAAADLVQFSFLSI
jgi:hypothetical protein